MAKEATSHAHKNAKLRDLVSCWSNLLPHRPRKECQICCEEKLVKAFGKTKQLPYDCRSHLRSICRRCVASSLSAQLDSKPLLAIGCPQCTAPWTRDDLMSLLASKDRKRYQRLDANAQRRAFIPAKHDMPERPTLDLLLESGARLCPWCQFPFIKDGQWGRYVYVRNAC